MKPKAHGPFKVFKRIGKNTYEIELTDGYRVSLTLNMANIIPYHVDGSEDLRITLFPLGENDIRLSLCAFVSNFMFLAQTFHAIEDLKIA